MPKRRGLTDKQVAGALARGDKRDYADPELRGHYLRVPARTSRAPIAFAAVARNPDRKQIWTTLGTADALGIDKAREMARQPRPPPRPGQSEQAEARPTRARAERATPTPPGGHSGDRRKAQAADETSGEAGQGRRTARGQPARQPPRHGERGESEGGRARAGTTRGGERPKKKKRRRSAAPAKRAGARGAARRRRAPGRRAPTPARARPGGAPRSPAGAAPGGRTTGRKPQKQLLMGLPTNNVGLSAGESSFSHERHINDYQFAQVYESRPAETPPKSGRRGPGGAGWAL